MSNGLRIRAITSREEWNSLRPVWNNLLLRSTSPTAYLTFEWLATWWDCTAGSDASLNILVVERGGEMVVLAPLMSVTPRRLGIPVRKIKFISSMKKAAHLSTVSAQLDIIACPGEEDAIAAIFAHLEAQRAHWDCLQLHPIPDSSPTLQCYQNSGAGRRFRYFYRPVLHTSVVRVDSPWEEYVKKQRRDVRKAMRMTEHAAAGVDGMRISEYRSLEELPGGFEALLDIEKRSWKWDKGVSLNAAIFGDFYRQLAKQLSGTGMLILQVLEVENREVAYVYAVEFGNVIWGQRMSFDESYRKHAPGKFMVYNLLRMAHQKRLAAVDFGWGEAQYKNALANYQKQHSELMVFSDSLRGRMSRLYYGLPGLPLAADRSADFARRIARHLGLHPSRSELTRADQLHGRDGNNTFQ